MYNKEDISKILNEILENYGLIDEESIMMVDSLSYLSLLIELETMFRFELPDEFLVKNMLLDTENFENIIFELQYNDKQ